MLWKFVFEYKKMLTDEGMSVTLDYVRELARFSGYSFMVFNGTVFFLLEDGDFYDTGITSEDLF